MAISSTHYHLLRSIRGSLPQGGSLLEIGEANWYGDMDLRELASDPGDAIHAAADSGNLFTMAKAAYATVFAPSVTHAVDMSGTPGAMRQDLNYPLQLDQQYDVVMNHGTAEHIFNVAQVYRSIHNATKPDGVMIHEGPFTGWIDHGFYTLQPTLYYDLAATNNYEMILCAIEHIDSKTVTPLQCREHLYDLAASGEIPNNAMLYVAMRKLFDGPFRIPTQGYYANRLSDSGKAAWRELR